MLNGPPAAGKSTLARRFVATRPLALNLDIDVVRSLLGRWLDQPHGAGLAARDLAVSMAATHLASGRDVIVPQFLGRTELIERLEEVAREAGAEFREVVLVIGRDEAIDAFARRSATSTDPSHRDALALVERSTSADPVGEHWDALQRVIAARPATIRVEVVAGDVDATFALLLEKLDARPSSA